MGKGGYKDYHWGDGYEAIRERVPDLGELKQGAGIQGVFTLFFAYLHPDDVAEVNPEINDMFGRMNCSYAMSDATGLTFWFADSKLVDVDVSVGTDSVERELIARHGDAELKGNDKIRIRVWRNDPARLIMWTQDPFEQVRYCDVAFYSKIEEPLLVHLRRGYPKTHLTRVS